MSTHRRKEQQHLLKATQHIRPLAKARPKSPDPCTTVFPLPSALLVTQDPFQALTLPALGDALFATVTLSFLLLPSGATS